jgi:hypothetical protein
VIMMIAEMGFAVNPFALLIFLVFPVSLYRVLFSCNFLVTSALLRWGLWLWLLARYNCSIGYLARIADNTMVVEVMSTQHSAHRTPPAEPVTLTRTIACDICHAVYSPAQDHIYLVQAPISALETAFMSMCHFCFRCRRPSCPACWDHVHGVCASCVQEMRLPFREELSPLRGAFFPPMRHAQEARVTVATAPLISIEPGQFQSADHNAIEKATTGPMKVITAASDSAPQKQNSSLQSNSALHSSVSSPQPDVDIDQVKTIPERSRSRSKRIERVITLLLLVVLLVVVALITTASLSTSANMFIATMLHIDIRAELAYLWQIINHLFS